MTKLVLLAAISLLVSACVTVPPLRPAPGPRPAPPSRPAAPPKPAAPVKPAPPAKGGPAESRDAVLLGEREVDFKADHDTIVVGAYEGSFRSLSFRVEKNDIELYNLVIEYGNGEKQRLESRLIFKEGSRSRLIGFAGGQRRIKTIQFTYKTVGSWLDGKARVVVYGLQ